MNEECPICFTNERLIEICMKSKIHRTCMSCYGKVNKCPLCRSELMEICDIDYIPYTDIYTKNEIKNIIESKMRNLNKIRLLNILSEEDLSILSSAKRDKKYKLYKYVMKEMTEYSSLYVSEWSTSSDILSENGLYLVEGEFDGNSILLDYNYIYENENDKVMVLAGKYEVKVICDINRLINIFIPENKMYIMKKHRNNNLFRTIPQLKKICKNYGIKHNCADKLSIINMLINYKEKI